MTGETGKRLPSFSTDPKAALESYLKLGYHIEKDVWSPDECQAIIRASENLPSFKDGTFGPGMQPHRLDPQFLSAMRSPKIVSIMERLVSGRVSGLQSVFYFGRPGTPGFTMHQDSAFTDTKPNAFATAWSAMQDVTPEMGALVGYPGTHREPILPQVAVEQPLQTVSQDPNANREEVVLPAGYQPVELAVPRGAVIFMHGHFVHSSGMNRTNQFRRALVLTYIRSGENFRPGFTAKRSEVQVY